MSQGEWEFYPEDDASYRGPDFEANVFVCNGVVRVRAEQGRGYMGQYTDISIPVHVLRRILNTLEVDR